MIEMVLDNLYLQDLLSLQTPARFTILAQVGLYG